MFEFQEPIHRITSLVNFPDEAKVIYQEYNCGDYEDGESQFVYVLFEYMGELCYIQDAQCACCGTGYSMPLEITDVDQAWNDSIGGIDYYDFMEQLNKYKAYKFPTPPARDEVGELIQRMIDNPNETLFYLEGGN